MSEPLWCNFCGHWAGGDECEQQARAQKMEKALRDIASFAKSTMSNEEVRGMVRRIAVAALPEPTCVFCGQPASAHTDDGESPRPLCPVASPSATEGKDDA